ncbi:uncharacterized protein F5147DRAFT_741222 [Suillus discolor]|uniref:DUF6533 domain-containing protein n=1 Tax=Suillus discolor TaxID=1912936 RepID=A0A9P7EPN2_9AGAM|nr:uncharacterized protein F5147DRAFT_741222 [Suillus discolor]KAG2079473.1 hypothetical protein F5147DRAFT_741222 [Suillus discolor]
MTIVSNDPTWWLSISANRFSSYFVVAAFIVITYDWALTFGQEVELVWVSTVSCQRNIHESTLIYRGNVGP